LVELVGELICCGLLVVVGAFIFIEVLVVYWFGVVVVKVFFVFVVGLVYVCALCDLFL